MITNRSAYKNGNFLNIEQFFPPLKVNWYCQYILMAVTTRDSYLTKLMINSVELICLGVVWRPRRTTASKEQWGRHNEQKLRRIATRTSS